MRADFHAADLFAGAGGMSEGLRNALQERELTHRLFAVNHWPTAIATHSQNHPEAVHQCAAVEAVDPRVAVPGGRLDLLMAAPECTHHSSARGGKPINDQSRASAWHIMRWLELLRVESVLIENVPEFQTWAPLGANGRPMKSRKGAIFHTFIETLRQYGFNVEFKVLNAADYGAATTRRRLFIIGMRGKKQVPWPAPTHSKAGGRSLLRDTAKWRAAREIIDWDIEGRSIFNRRKPLKRKTLARIIEGIGRFNPELEPFLVILRQHMGARSLDRPLPTIMAEGTHIGLAEPFLIPFYGERPTQAPRAHSVDEPVPVIPSSGNGKFGVIEPHVLQLTHGGRTRSVNVPLPVITTANRGELGVVEPFVITPGGADLRNGRAVSDPLPTVTTSDRFAVVEPFILGQHSGGIARSITQPTPTVAADGALQLVEPFLLPPRGFSKGPIDSVDQPVRTIKAVDGHVFGLCEPHISKYYGTARTGQPVNEPLDTLTSKARFALVQPVINGYTLDIRYRMLQPHELSAAMSFPKTYIFTGNKGDRIRQIGNAVDCNMSRALAGAIIDALRPTAATRTHTTTINAISGRELSA